MLARRLELPRGASLDDYLRRHGIVASRGSTRARSRATRDHGAQDGIICSVASGPAGLLERARALPGLLGRDLVAEVTVTGALRLERGGWTRARLRRAAAPRFSVVAYDCGIKFNILRQLRMTAATHRGAGVPRGGSGSSSAARRRGPSNGPATPRRRT